MKSFVNSLLSVCLCSVLILFCLWRNAMLPDLSGVTAFVRETAGAVDNAVGIIQGNGKNDAGSRPTDEGGLYSGYDLTENVSAELENAICAGYNSLSESIDVSSFHLSQQQASEAVSKIRFSHPEFFYLGNYCQYVTMGGEVKSIRPNYEYNGSPVTAQQVESMNAEYRAALSELVAGISTESSDFDKILYLHDYFVQNYQYDYTLTIRDAYTLFTQKTGVCQAYMLGLIAASHELGLECEPVTSSVMKHAWNLVEVDGSWYHVDATWDDTMAIPSFTNYTYFLRSDTGLYAEDEDEETENQHREWSAYYDADNDKYEAVAFRDSYSPIVHADGVYYCVAGPDSTVGGSRGQILSGTDVTAMTKLIDITGDYWVAGTQGYYCGCYSGLAVSGPYLFYNSGKTIFVYRTDTSTRVYSQTQFSLLPKESIYGFFGIEGNCLTYCVALSPDDDEYKQKSLTFVLS